MSQCLVHCSCAHPVPLYHWEGMGPDGMSHHVPCSVPNPMCPSHLIVPLGGDGTGWDVPPCTMQCAQSHVSIPSHCTIGRGWDRMGCPTMYHAVCPIPCVCPVPLYHWEGPGMGGMSSNVPCKARMGQNEQVMYRYVEQTKAYKGLE